MDDAFRDARAALDAWRDDYPDDPYAADPHLDALNAHYLAPERLEAVRGAAGAFGRRVAGELGSLVAAFHGRDPELEPFDGLGHRVERVRFDPAYHEAGRLVWASGLLEHALTPGRSFEQASLFYLASLEGEMGHLCAATCTTGAARVIRRAGDAETLARFLPPLGERDYDVCQRAAQFLTEVQGGSDVGRLATRAHRGKDGHWRIHGEKWFCSVVDAEQFLVLARPTDAPDGTAGLGCFVIPRTVAGRPNGFSIRRLKDKLGTRSMASGEIDFQGALAHPVGPVDEGFRIMVTAMLNTSRWLNALGDVGIMRRAWLEASAYARHRHAFGRRIEGFPLVRRQLAGMRAEWLAALHSTWRLTALDEAVDTGRATDAELAEHRFLVNANKLGCSIAATAVVRQAIEILGGNGAIESFSVLPRLLRDAVVYEQWEGTHNVLTAQVHRDFTRLGLADAVLDGIAGDLAAGCDGGHGAVASRALAAFEPLARAVRAAVDDAEHGAWHFRALLERLWRARQVALLLDAAAHSPALAPALAAAAGWLIGEFLEARYAAENDSEFKARVEALLGDKGA